MCHNCEEVSRLFSLMMAAEQFDQLSSACAQCCREGINFI